MWNFCQYKWSVCYQEDIIVEGRMELVTSYMVHQLPRTQSDGECCLHLLWIAKLEGRMLITDNMHNSPFDCKSQNILSS